VLINLDLLNDRLLNRRVNLSLHQALKLAEVQPLVLDQFQVGCDSIVQPFHNRQVLFGHFGFNLEHAVLGGLF
jgi:hypothetical protein